MYTQAEKRAAAKLYSLLYKGANIYNAPNRTKKGWSGEILPDAVNRFAGIVRELNAHMKEIDNG